MWRQNFLIWGKTWHTFQKIVQGFIVYNSCCNLHIKNCFQVPKMHFVKTHWDTESCKATQLSNESCMARSTPAGRLQTSYFKRQGLRLAFSPKLGITIPFTAPPMGPLPIPGFFLENESWASAFFLFRLFLVDRKRNLWRSLVEGKIIGVAVFEKWTHSFSNIGFTPGTPSTMDWNSKTTYTFVNESVTKWYDEIWWNGNPNRFIHFHQSLSEFDSHPKL